MLRNINWLRYLQKCVLESQLIHDVSDKAKYPFRSKLESMLRYPWQQYAYEIYGFVWL